MGDSSEYGDLKLLLKQIRTHPPFEREEELALAIKVRKGDKRAREKLALHNLGLVVSVANRYRARGFRLDDLVQEGNCGLVKAIEHFDPHKGYRFSTYAVWWIEAYILRALSRGAGAVARPRSVGPAGSRDLSLDEPTAPGGDTTHLDLLEDESIDAPEDCARRAELSAQVRSSLKKVRKRMGDLGWAIVCGRFMEDDPRKLQDIGDDWGLSRERVRQLELRTRHFLGRYLADFKDAA